MSRILVSGSIATDVIMNFHDQFGNYIMPEKTNALSVSFNIGHLIRHAGGAGHNIAYNLGLLDEKASLVAFVGPDFIVPEQCEHLVDYSAVEQSMFLPTAIAHIITDDKNNQITAFYAGAILESTEQDLPEGEFSFAIISPNHPVTMMRHLQQAVTRGIVTFFDPGQPLSAFSREQLQEVVSMGVYLIVNEYEKELFLKISGYSFEELKTACAAVLITEGEQGSTLYMGAGCIHVDAFPVDEIVDPTGCGDAYRAGLLRGLQHEMDRAHAMLIGSYMASLCIQSEGTMEHRL